MGLSCLDGIAESDAEGGCDGNTPDTSNGWGKGGRDGGGVTDTCFESHLRSHPLLMAVPMD